jgi:N-methylhydantoinase A
MTSDLTFRLGCDIGGTFTDFVLLNQDTGRFEVHKTLTTPTDPSEAVEIGIVALQQQHDGFLAKTENVIHGTTLVINAVIERKGAPTAIIATEGFRDSLEMRREIRYDIYDIGAVYPTPLVDRPFRREVPERIYSDGRVRRPLDTDAAREVFNELAAQGIESVAISLLHAYANPEHEQALETIAAAAHPDLAISLSSDVMPEIKEFERTSTTAVNAYVKPLMARYIKRLEERLASRGFERGLFMMLSSGGIIAPETARKFPVRMIESGPVGGALAAAQLGRQAGLRDVVMFDMGGTTAKSCLIRDGVMPISTEYEVDRVHRFKKGSGTPLGVPTVDIIEIGAGGGSIASVDELGLLQVGPLSAGAAPGPICYGDGGTKPTVTDADLVLGYLDPAYFLGGKMDLDLSETEVGIAREIGEPLGFSVLQAAWGIHEVVNENMAAAIRMYVTEMGGDLNNATVVSIGGAGPVHADSFARKLGVKRLIMPRGAGVYSALGFLVAPVSYEISRTRITSLKETNAAHLGELFKELEAAATPVIKAAAPGAAISFNRIAEICYLGQGSTVRVTLPDSLDPETIAARFLEEYRNRYGASYDDLDVQIVTLRITATAQQDQRTIALPFETEGGDASLALKGERMAFAPDLREMVLHKVYTMDKLPAGARLTGPAIIEEESSTLVIGRGGQAEVDARGWIVVELGDAKKEGL